jgi:aerobic-type carbon monoxide dehydrogenase small subunit (CoxS/CutS family)
MPILEITVNDKPYKLEVDGRQTLVDVIRNDLHLTGTKIGCREGECGSCTVLLDGKAVNSCLIPAMKAHKRSVVTVEGVGTSDSPHPVQAAFAEEGAVQCGYCTPGFVMSAVALLDQKPEPSTEDILEALEGNLCRCTGYKRIVDAILAASRKMASNKENTSQESSKEGVDVFR